MFWLEILLQVLIRVPKGFRAPGLQVTNCRAPQPQDKTIGARGLHGCTLRFHLALIVVFVWAPSSVRLWAPGSRQNFCGSRPPRTPSLKRSSS